jgi:hypothetical protein
LNHVEELPADMLRDIVENILADYFLIYAASDEDL